MPKSWSCQSGSESEIGMGALWLRRQLLAVLVSVVVALMALPAIHAQQTFSHGAVVALRGTPHLWIADARGVLHWGGDTRALAGKHVNWNDRTEVTVAQLRGLTVGDPWLSAGLLKDGDPIYLVKWESNWERPRLLHIQSIADVELFGIDGSNYGRFVLDRATWEAKYGMSAASLQRSALPAAVTTAIPPTPTTTPTPVPRPTIDPILAHAYHVMRRSQVGNEVAGKFVWLGTSATFGALGDSISQWVSSPPRIIVNEDYRYESPEALAYALIWPTVGLALHNEHGLPQSWEECMQRTVSQESAQARYWLETYGANGKSNPTRLGQGANYELERYLSGRLDNWVRRDEHYRQQCARYGEPSPLPTPEPMPTATPLPMPTPASVPTATPEPAWCRSGCQTLLALPWPGLPTLPVPTPMPGTRRWFGDFPTTPLGSTAVFEYDAVTWNVTVIGILRTRDLGLLRGYGIRVGQLRPSQEVLAVRLKITNRGEHEGRLANIQLRTEHDSEKGIIPGHALGYPHIENDPFWGLVLQPGETRIGNTRAVFISKGERTLVMVENWPHGYVITAALEVE